MGIDGIRTFFQQSIGEGRRFATQTDMARFLGLKVTTATKLYTFLKGADTQSSAVIDWIERLGGNVILPPTQREDGISGEAGVREGGMETAEADLEKEIVSLKAQLAAARETAKTLEGLLRDALTSGRGAAAEPPAAEAKRKAG